MKNIFHSSLSMFVKLLLFFSSIIYKIESGARLTIHQQVQTLGGTDVAAFEIGSDVYLAIANSRDDVAMYDHDVVVYVWNGLTELFEAIQRIESRNVQSIHVFAMPSNMGMLRPARLLVSHHKFLSYILQIAHSGANTEVV